MSEEKPQSIGALWTKQSAKGEYMTGSVDLPDGSKLKVVVFKNNYKTEEKHPDWKIFVSKPREEKAAWPTPADLDANGPADTKGTDDPF